MLEFLGVMGMVEIGGNEREKEEETGGINLLLNGNFRLNKKIYLINLNLFFY